MRRSGRFFLARSAFVSAFLMMGMAGEGSAVGAPLAPAAGPTTAPAAAPSASPSVVSIEVPGSQRIASGLIVRDTGLIATSFSFASSVERARVVFPNGATSEVSGYVAARKGKDLVILALKKPPKGLTPLKIDPRLRKLGTPIAMQAGPSSAPLVFNSTQLLTLRAGDETMAGRALPRSPIGDDPDACWLTADSFMPASAIGGAILDSEGALLGMLVAAPGNVERVNTAIHAAHIEDLLKSVELRARPLASLRNFQDSVRSNIPESVPQSVMVSGVEERSTSLEGWASSLSRRLMVAEAELATYRPREDAIRLTVKDQVAKEREMKKSLLLVEDLRANMRPEIVNRRRKLVTYDVPGKTGGREVKQEIIFVNESEFSPRQKERMVELESQATAMKQQITALQLEIQVNEYRGEQVAADLAAGQRLVSSLWNELFVLADPLELRRPEESRQCLTQLAPLNDKFGTTAPILLAKSLLHLRLREFDRSEELAAQAEEFDKTTSSVVQAIRARIAYLTDKESSASALISKVGKKGLEDPRTLLVTARFEIDRGNFNAAQRQLKLAGERGADPVEIDLASALLMSTSPQKSALDPPAALQLAGRACFAARWKDWRGLVALAAANAAHRKYSVAAELLDRAGLTAPAEYESDMERWKSNVADAGLLEFPWK